MQENKRQNGEINSRSLVDEGYRAGRERHPYTHSHSDTHAQNLGRQSPLSLTLVVDVR